MRKLRDYQQAAIDGVKQAWAQGCRGVFVCMPTGSGKTFLFTEIIRERVERGQRCVVLAHRGELIQQAGRTIAENGMQHGVIQAGPSTFPLAPIQICSIDSMATRALPWEPDLIVIDEAHLVKSARYLNFLEQYPLARLLLVSATPIRTDGTGFDDLAQRLVIGATINDLIESSSGPFLVPARIFTGSDTSELDKAVKTTAGEYNLGQLEQFMSSSQLVGDVVQEYLKRAAGRKGVVFCVGIKHSQLIASQFRNAGIRAEHLDGTTPAQQRKDILARLKSGQTQIVTNAAVLCEGYDEPSISYVGLARPTKSLALFIQQAGRGLRIHPESGKVDCVVIDHGGNTDRHGHILEEREWSLDGKDFKGPKKKKKHKECEQCGAWYAVHLQACPECGYQKVHILPHHQQGNLHEVGKPNYHPVILEYRKLLRYAKDRGRKPGWAYFALCERLGKAEVDLNLSYNESKRHQRECYGELERVLSV